MPDKKPVILVFRDWLLPASETFIYNQTECLAKYTPWYLGTYREKNGLPLPEDRTIIVGDGRLGWIKAISFILRGPSRSLLKRLRALEPVLLQAHFGPDAVRALPIAKALSIPMCVYYHGYDATTLPEYMARSYKGRQYLKNMDKIKSETSMFFTDSDFIRNKLIEQGFPNDRVFTHYIGLDLSQFVPGEDKEPIVLFVGRLVEKKGCEYLIRAMAKVQIEMPETRLVIIGDGPLLKPLKTLTISLNVSCEFIGWKTPEQVRDWMKRAMVFSVPSVTAPSGDSEGLPTVLVEAQAMGLPVVSFISNGIPEAVEDKKTGFLFPEKDVDNLAQAILRLLRDPELRKKMGEEGRKRVELLFDIRKQTSKLEEYYDKICG